MNLLNDFLDGEKKVASLTLRPFTIGSKLACEQLNLTMFTTGEVSTENSDAERQLMMFAWLHSQPLPKVLAAIRNGTAKESAEEFAFSVPIGDLQAVISEINRISLAVTSANVDVQQKPGSGGDDAPGNFAGQDKLQA